MKQPDLTTRINKQHKIFLPKAIECCGVKISITHRTGGSEVKLFTKTGVEHAQLFQGKYIYKESTSESLPSLPRFILVTLLMAMVFDIAKFSHQL